MFLSCNFQYIWNLCLRNSLFCTLGEKSALILSTGNTLFLRMEIFLCSYINQTLPQFLIRRQIDSFNLSLIESYAKMPIDMHEMSSEVF